MEAANSASAAGSKTVRGWTGFGSGASTSTSRMARSAPVGALGSGSGRRALSPLPSAFRFMFHQFRGQLEVGNGPARPDVVTDDRLAEAGGLGQANVARDAGSVD